MVREALLQRRLEPWAVRQSFETHADEGKRDEFEAVAIKEVLAWQIAEAMKTNNLSRSALAVRMKTSRSQIGRLLDPMDGNVTISTLQRAARIVGRSLRLELV
jgi:antitoxin HicB